jgi:hypothetical protein
MPFKSKAQQRFMFAAESQGKLKPGTARKWAHETKDMKKLPEHVKKAAFADAVFDELEKLADLRFGDPKHPVTSLGIFLHADEGKERKVHKEWMDLFSKHRSPIKALSAYTKRHPNTFTTALIKHEAPPGLLSFKQKALYADKVKNPRLFVRIGPAGSHSQHAMYQEAMRGLYDDELHHAPKDQRHVYG